jgi:hypothetical protein
VQVLFGHGDRAGGLVQLERDLRRAQHVGRFGRGLGVEPGVQRTEVGLLRPEEHHQPGRDRAGDHQQRAHLLEHRMSCSLEIAAPVRSALSDCLSDSLERVRAMELRVPAR